MIIVARLKVDILSTYEIKIDPRDGVVVRASASH